MKLKWGEEKIRGFSNPIKKVEKGSDWAWWPLLITVVIIVIIVLSKIL